MSLLLYCKINPELHDSKKKKIEKLIKLNYVKSSEWKNQ